MESLLRYLNNWFIAEILYSTYTIENGTLAVDVPDGQYIRIIGSALNDGVYQCPITGLSSETFTGAVWKLAIPPLLIELQGDIETWKAANESSGFTSESFGGYSYSRATKNGIPLSWEDVFADRLKPFRKVPLA